MPNDYVQQSSHDIHLPDKSTYHANDDNHDPGARGRGRAFKFLRLTRFSVLRTRNVNFSCFATLQSCRAPRDLRRQCSKSMT
mmetsp:Transcript_62726/g.127433  ORF Transcript_62726/g.127433 Transcript_62726/m.127433 type:complete len:82 (-) Transcript_62726:8-253(-)